MDYFGKSLKLKPRIERLKEAEEQAIGKKKQLLFKFFLIASNSVSVSISPVRTKNIKESSPVIVHKAVW